jgi:orotidine-5'-phosphate decarboxylase
MSVHNLQLRSEKGIILAADVSDLDDLSRLVRTCAGFSEIAAIKVGFTLALKYGLSAVVTAINAVSSLAVIYDHQKAGTDIPQMGKPFAEVCRDAGVKAVIFFPQAGPKTLEGFVSAAFDAGMTPIVGLVMTHAAYLKSEGGYIVDEAPELMAKAAVELGVKDFVLPGTKPEIVKRFASGLLSNVKTASIMMPGIGSQGGSLKSAFRAALPHRRFAIIGSAIYAAKEPRLALENFVQEMHHE